MVTSLMVIYCKFTVTGECWSRSVPASDRNSCENLSRPYL